MWTKIFPSGLCTNCYQLSFSRNQRRIREFGGSTTTYLWVSFVLNKIYIRLGNYLKESIFFEKISFTKECNVFTSSMKHEMLYSKRNSTYAINTYISRNQRDSDCNHIVLWVYKYLHYKFPLSLTTSLKCRYCYYQSYFSLGETQPQENQGTSCKSQSSVTPVFRLPHQYNFPHHITAIWCDQYALPFCSLIPLGNKGFNLLNIISTPIKIYNLRSQRSYHLAPGNLLFT